MISPSFGSLCTDLRCLVPPGEGVFTVHTQKDRKISLQQKLYGSGDPEIIRQKWLASLGQIQSADWVLLGVPCDTGGGILRGANWGPLGIRESFYPTSLKVLDLGDIRVVPQFLHDRYLNQDTLDQIRAALYGDSAVSYPVSPLSITEWALDLLYAQYPGVKVLTLGGDHAISFATLRSFLKHHRNVGVVHFDAHTDLMKSRLGVELSFASWARQLLPDLERSEQWVQVGIRSSGQDQAYWEQETGVKQFWAAEFFEKGTAEVARSIRAHFEGLGIRTLYVTFDIDVLDVSCAAATGTPEPKGLTVEQIGVVLNALQKDFVMAGGDLVEVAPFTIGDLNYRDQEPHTTLQNASLILEAILTRA